ncbi:MAG: hypothetical protein IJU93_08425 [Lachnospiraceae bacterium]|nr:hypothetical protein [Lachnospiraceae bacterium]
MADQQLIEDKEEDDKKKKKKEKKDKKKGKNSPEGTEEEEDEGGILSVILVTIVIVLIWLAILALLIKLDVGGFGSNIATPILKNVPMLNRVLPGYSLTVSSNEAAEDDEYAGYKSIEDAVDRIKILEEELLLAQESVNNSQQTIADLNEQISRLETFRDNQVAFEKIRDEYYNEVVFGDSAPSIEEYKKYYEEIDPVNAEILYKQVVQQEQVDEQLKNYAKTYSSMKAKDCAGIFESQIMRGYIELTAKILGQMGTDARADVLAAMDPELAGQLTKIMEPDENVNTNFVDTGSLLGLPEEETNTDEDTASDNSTSQNGTN